MSFVLLVGKISEVHLELIQSESLLIILDPTKNLDLSCVNAFINDFMISSLFLDEADNEDSKIILWTNESEIIDRLAFEAYEFWIIDENTLYQRKRLSDTNIFLNKESGSLKVSEVLKRGWWDKWF